MGERAENQNPNRSGSLFDALDSQANATLDALDALRDTLTEKVTHPQEFGMDGCPACKSRSLLSEASLLIQEAQARIREWQPEGTAE